MSIRPSDDLAGKYWAYTVTDDGRGWRCLGLFDDENSARAAVGLPLVFT